MKRIVIDTLVSAFRMEVLNDFYVKNNEIIVFFEKSRLKIQILQAKNTFEVKHINLDNKYVLEFDYGYGRKVELAVLNKIYLRCKEDVFAYIVDVLETMFNISLNGNHFIINGKFGFTLNFNQ